MWRTMLGVALLFCVEAHAQGVMVGRRLVGKGDAAAILRDAAGAPDRLDRIDGDATTPAMEIWTYRREGRETTAWLVAGRIVKVTQEPVAAARDGSG